MMTLPNLIIGGAPKAGTTSLHNWLSHHPELFGSPVKETYFLEDRESHMFKAKANLNLHGPEAYQAFFKGAKAEHKWVFESTPNYLYQKTALDFFKAYAQQPKIIFSFRNPTDRILSQYNYNLYTLGKFSNKVGLGGFIEAGLATEDTYIEIEGHRLLNPMESNKYVKYLKPWQEAFEGNNFIFLDFQDIRNKPKSVLLNISKILEIEASFWATYDIERSNASHFNRSKKLYHLLNKAGKRFPQGQAVFKVIHDLNTVAKPALKPEDRMRLKELDLYFKDWNSDLAQSTGLKLDHWAFKS